MKKRNLFMSLTIMCGLFAAAFTFNSNEVTWLWKGNEPIGVILGFTSILLGTQWIRFQRQLNKAKHD